MLRTLRADSDARRLRSGRWSRPHGVPGCAGGADSGGALGVFGTETGAGVPGELGLESPGWRNQMSAAVTTSTPMTAATAVSTSLRFRGGR